MLQIPYKMRAREHLGYEGMLQSIIKISNQVNDKRSELNQEYSVKDAMLSAFACMFLQCSSLLEYTQLMEIPYRKKNLQQVFKLTNIPSVTQLRTILDDVDPNELLRPIWKNVIQQCQRGKVLEKYDYGDQYYLTPLDGTQYFTSNKVSCEKCLTSEKEEKRNYHQALQAAIVHPNIPQPLPLMAEPIQNTDGNTKQDCETNAAKRLLKQVHTDYPKMKHIWLGDGLFSNAPFIKEVRTYKDNFLLTIKPGDHKHMITYLGKSTWNHYRGIGSRPFNPLNVASRKPDQCKEEDLVCEWQDNVPLNKTSGVCVTVLRAFRMTVNKEGKSVSTMIGMWCTDLSLTKENIIKWVMAAKSRWMIENECFNAVKNKGYCLEHNYGHGEKNLAFNFYLITFLAFTIQQIMELTDSAYKASRKAVRTVKGLWQKIREIFDLFVLESWDVLLLLIYDTNEYWEQKSAEFCGRDPPTPR